MKDEKGVSTQRYRFHPFAFILHPSSFLNRRPVNSDVMLLPDVTYQILGWSLIVVAALTPVLVIVFSIRNYRRGSVDFETARFKALVALFVWLSLTLVMFLFLGFLAFVMSHAMSHDPSARPHPTLTYLVIHVMYFAVCYLLVDWMSRRKRLGRDKPVSPGAT
jgi:uncharacterized integral membrane protein